MKKPSILNGQYADPDKNRKQNTIHFHFLPNTGIIQKLHVELRLQSENGYLENIAAGIWWSACKWQYANDGLNINLH